MILNKCLKYLLHWCFRSSRSNNNIDPVYNLVRNPCWDERGERRRRGWLRDRKVVKHRDLHIYDVGGGGGGSDHPPPFRCWWCIERRYLGIFTVRWSHHLTPVDGLLWGAGGGNHLLLIISPLLCIISPTSSGEHPGPQTSLCRLPGCTRCLPTV